MKKVSIIILAITAAVLSSCSGTKDVCIYGGTASAVVAARSAAAMGASVILVSPDERLGGMTTGGLGQTDIGNKSAVTGIARQFYRQIGEEYNALERWTFEPKTALRILEGYLRKPGIKVLKGYRLESVEMDGTRITGITAATKDGETVSVKALNFIDATYEGDLMAKAGVSYVVGREGSEVYGEPLNGQHISINHQFPDGVDPYVEPGNPESGLLWGISDRTVYLGEGAGDSLVQAYNIRICLTDKKENMVPITEPENYDPSKYELLARLFEAQPDIRAIGKYFIWSSMPGNKTDINNKGGFSTDMIGMNYDWPEATYQQRDSIYKAHTDYTKGLLWFYASDPRVPEKLSEFVRKWGYPKDEYTETGNWTPQLYVREARRMVGEYVATQADCESRTLIEDGIAMAAYNMDSHNCQRIVVVKDGKAMVKNEGNVEVNGGQPYPISYRSITPKREECTNLLVPVCLSASHIAYGSIRMEPVFMALGQAAGIAAAGCKGRDVQDADVKELQRILAEDPYLDGSAPEICIDDDSELVTATGGWVGRKARGCYGKTCMELPKGKSGKIVYDLPDNLRGDWEVFVYTFKDQSVNQDLKYVLRMGNIPFERPFVPEKMKYQGQTSNGWFSLGVFKMLKGYPLSLELEIKNGGKPTRSDAVLLIKR